MRGFIPGRSTFTEAILPVSPTSNRIGGLYYDVACDIERSWVFYADIMDNVVYKIRPTGADLKTVLVTNNDGLVSMSYDWVSQIIYYVDNIRNSLEIVHAENASSTRQLLKQLKEPTSVVIHPGKGYVPSP